MKLEARILTTCAAIAISSIAAGQTLLWEYVSPNSTGDVGSSCTGPASSCPGDLNFDGVSDVLVSCHSSPNGAQPDAGYVGLLSGVDGTLIYELHGIGGGAVLGAVAPMRQTCSGDVDGDGTTDFWIALQAPGTPTSTVSQLLSGATGTVIASPPPWAVSGFLAGRRSQRRLDCGLRVRLGVTHRIRRACRQPRSFGPSPTPSRAADAFAPVLQERRPDRRCERRRRRSLDLLTGVTGRCFESSFSAPGAAYVVSGAKGAFLRQWNGSSQLRLLRAAGHRVPGTSTATTSPMPSSTFPGYGFGGIRCVLDGLGEPACVLSGASHVEHYAHGLVALGDVDGDGFREFAVQGPDVSHVEVISVATSTILYTLNAPPTIQYPVLGESLGSSGGRERRRNPRSGHGTAGVLFSRPSGSVRMYSLAPVGVSAFGSGCPQADGSLARIGAPQSAQAGQPFTLNLSVVPPNVGALALFGLSNAMNGTTPLPWNLASYGMPSCSLFVSLDLVIETFTGEIRPGEGGGVFHGDDPGGPRWRDVVRPVGGGDPRRIRCSGGHD